MGGKSRPAPPAPPADSPYWTEKSTEENRMEGDGMEYTGTISSYNFKQGWGFLLPDDPASLPEDVQVKIAAGVAEAEAKGKKVGDPNLLYFRKPDIVEGFKAEKGAAITFQVYTDD